MGSFLKRADLPKEVADCSLKSIQSRLIQIRARVVRHARKITFHSAEMTVPRNVFGQILAAIRALKHRRGLHDGHHIETSTKAARRVCLGAAQTVQNPRAARKTNVWNLKIDDLAPNTAVRVENDRQNGQARRNNTLFGKCRSNA
jgi:hypothetical protein